MVADFMMTLLREHLWTYNGPDEWTFSLCLVCKEMHRIFVKRRLYMPYSAAIFAQSATMFAFAVKHVVITPGIAQVLATSGSREVIVALLEDFTPEEDFFETIIDRGFADVAQEHLENGMLPYDQLGNCFAKSGSLDQLKWALDRAGGQYDSYCISAIQGHRLDNLIYLMGMFTPWLPGEMTDDEINLKLGDLASAMLDSDAVDMLDWLWHTYPNMELPKNMLNTHAWEPRTIVWFINHGGGLLPDMCAVLMESMPIQQIIKEIGPRHAPRLAEAAYVCGMRDILAYLCDAYDCDVNTTIPQCMYSALRTSSIERLNYLYSRSVAIPHWALDVAIHAGDLEVIAWLTARVRVEVTHLEMAAKYGNVAALKIIWTAAPKNKRNFWRWQSLRSLPMASFIWAFSTLNWDANTIFRTAKEEGAVHISSWLSRHVPQQLG